MKKSFLVLFILSVSFSFAQSSKNFDWENVSYGGRINLDLSNTFTSIILAPTALYEINEQFYAGGSVSFGYTKARESSLKMLNYGVSVIAIYKITPMLELSSEVEENFVNWKGDNYSNKNDYLSWYLGAAYRVRKFALGVRYDLLYKEDTSIYTSAIAPFVRFYF